MYHIADAIFYTDVVTQDQKRITESQKGFQCVETVFVCVFCI